MIVPLLDLAANIAVEPVYNAAAGPDQTIIDPLDPPDPPDSPDRH